MSLNNLSSLITNCLFSGSFKFFSLKYAHIWLVNCARVMVSCPLKKVFNFSEHLYGFLNPLFSLLSFFSFSAFAFNLFNSVSLIGTYFSISFSYRFLSFSAISLYISFPFSLKFCHLCPNFFPHSPNEIPGNSFTIFSRLCDTKHMYGPCGPFGLFGSFISFVEDVVDLPPDPVLFCCFFFEGFVSPLVVRFALW